MAQTYFRSFNPVWNMRTLTGLPLDDTYYCFFLQNTIPYTPETIYATPSGTPLSNPLQLTAAGTLPIDVYFDPSLVYRIEVRQGDQQSDPLIWLAENYTPAGGSGGSSGSASLSSDNQMTNPQFSLVNFDADGSISISSAGTYEVAPGWELVLAGSGTATITREALTSAEPNPTNAPYALRLNLVGWTSGSGTYLKQRFDQAGMLWNSSSTVDNYVSSAVTSKLGSGANNTISATLVDSNGTQIATILSTTTVTQTYAQFTGVGVVDAPSNTDTPPAAWVEYRLLVPGSVDLLVTSLQVISTATASQLNYEQETIERQVDHTWHIYRDSVLRQSKQSILTGWDFGLNPWQSHATTTTNLATFGYVADQTIVVQQEYVANTNGNNISTERSAVATNYGFQVSSVTATNQFAIIQYIDPTTVRPYWGSTLSAMVKLTAQIQGSGVPMKARLIYRASLPPTLAQDEPITTWVADASPAFKSGWTAVASLNDPEYTIVNGENTLTFDSFDLTSVPSTNANMTLGIVLYTTASMDSSGTPDHIIFNRVSLVDNDYAIDCNALTFDETLRRCQYYYQKSFAVSTLPAAAAGLANAYTGINGVVGNVANTAGPQVRFPVAMRAAPSVATYNPGAGGTALIYDITNALAWAATSLPSSIGVSGFYISGTPNSTSTAGHGSAIHWSANARLGK